MSRQILLYGAGGTGRTLAFFLSVDKSTEAVWKVNGFIDDTMPHLWGKALEDFPVLGGYDYLRNYAGNIAVCIAQNPIAKKNLVSKLRNNTKIRFPLVSTSNVLISPHVTWGEGCIAAHAFSVINPGTKIGNFVIVLDRASVGDDVTIGDYSTLYAGINIGATASIGSYCVIGSGVTILPRVRIGDGSIIGAGSVVTKDIPSQTVAFGAPARIVREIL